MMHNGEGIEEFGKWKDRNDVDSNIKHKILKKYKTIKIVNWPVINEKFSFFIYTYMYALVHTHAHTNSITHTYNPHFLFIIKFYIEIMFLRHFIYWVRI